MAKRWRNGVAIVVFALISSSNQSLSFIPSEDNINDLAMSILEAMFKSISSILLLLCEEQGRPGLSA